MFNMKRASQNKKSPQPTIVKSSEDRPQQAFHLGMSAPRPATSLSQRFSNTAGPSTSFFAASGEFDTSTKSLPRGGSEACVAQMDIESESHGATNPSSFDFDRSSGYLPVIDRGVQSLTSSGPQATRTGEASCTSLESFLQLISSERLNRMPHRASKWDRVIRLLEGLAIQTSACTTCCTNVSSTRSDAASKIFSTCYSLLRFGSREPAFLDLCVPVLSTVHSALSIALQQKHLFTRNEKIQQILDVLLIGVLEVLNEALAYCKDFASDSCLDMNLSHRSIGVIQDRRDQLLDEMWACQLAPDISDSQNLVKQIEFMRGWLKPGDRMVHTLSANMWSVRTLQAEFTCEWLSRPLLDFIRSRDTAFWIEGPTGCGKSVLFSWIVDCLQHQVGGQQYNVLEYSVDPLLLSELGVSSLLRGLLQRAFNQYIGLSSLYDALAKAIDLASKSESLTKVTEALWNAFDVLLQLVPQPSIIVIDGITELSGGDVVVRQCVQRLCHIVSNSRSTRLVLLSRSFDQPPETDLRRFAIQRSDLHEDIQRVIDKALVADPLKNRAEITDWIMSRANCNYLWSLLILQISKWESSHGIPTPLRSLPTTLDATMSLLVSKVDFQNPTIRLLLHFSLVAIRPLRVDEAQSLLSVDVASSSFNKQEVDVVPTIEQSCASILTVDDGIIRLRHPDFKRPLRETAAATLKTSLQDIHTEMATRLLLYLKLVITARSELTLKPVCIPTVEDILRSHQLVPYALRYWTWHCESGHPFHALPQKAGNDLRLNFPESTFTAVLEATFWRNQPHLDALQALHTATQTRQAILGSHYATLQATALLATHLKLVGKLPEAASNFAIAFRLARQLLPEFHDFAVSCVLECFEYLRSVPKSAPTDLPMTVPDILHYLICKYGKQLGPADDQVLEYYQILARHYLDTDQYGLSIRVQRDIFRLTVDRFGKSSTQARAVAGDLATLLQKSDQTEDRSQCNDLVYDNVMDAFAITDSRRVKAAIHKAKTCRLQNDTVTAELEYLNLMHGVTEKCIHRENDGSREVLANVGLQYADLLFEQDRTAEAQIVLLGLWACFEGRQDRTPAANHILKDVALRFQQAGLPAVALTIFSSVSKWSENHADESNVLQAVKETTLHLTSGLLSDVQDGSVLPKATEDALVQTFESAKSQGILTMDASIISLCQKLINSFTLEKRWRDVLYVASGVLQLLWPAVLDSAAEHPALGGFDPALGQLAVRLAHAYSMIDAEDTAGHIYWYVLCSAKSSSLMESPFFASTAKAALKTLAKSGQSKKMIDVTQELVGHYQATLGEVDAVTIDWSYALASLCMECGETDVARRQYERITASLQMPEYHERSALPALQALIVIFRSKKLWDQAGKIYSSLWQTFLTKGKDYGVHESTAQSLFKDYSQLLTNHPNSDSRSNHQIREEYRLGCLSAFGEASYITLGATTSLAKSWEERQSNSPEAIHLYESIIDQSSVYEQLLEPDVSEMLDQVETILRQYYGAHLDDDPDQQTLSRAIMLQEKQFAMDRISHGRCSLTSLTSFATWVSFLSKEGSAQSRDTAVKELKQAVEYALESDCEGKFLFDVASILASTYVEGEYTDEGLKIAQKIRERIVFRDTSGEDFVALKDLGFGHRSKVTFLTAFEARLGGSMEGFAEILSRTLLEVTLWDSFQEMMSSSSQLEQVLARGASVQAMLMSHYPTYKGESLQQQLFDLFMATYSQAFTTGPQAIKRFFAVLSAALSTQRSDVELPHLACIAVNEEAQLLLEKEDFTGVLMVSGPGFEFIRYVSAYEQDSDLEYGFQLGLLLGEVGPRLCLDHVNSKQMLELSKIVLREVMQLCRTREFSLERISIEELSKVAAVLGRQQNYYDLEWVLNRLWLSRHKRGPLSQDTIITLGRRLVDVRFFHGHTDSAIDLAEDILYNLRQVYGPLHRSAIEMMNLLSSIYMSKGDRAAALAVHDSADSGVTNIGFVDEESVVREEPSHSDKQIRSKIESLLQQYQHNDGPEKSSRQSSSLVDELTKRLTAPAPDFKSGAVKGHQPPSNWSFATGREEESSARFEELA